MKDSSLKLVGGVKVSYHVVFTFRHQSQEAIDLLMKKIRKAGIKHRKINSDDTKSHCLTKGCLKDTGMHIPVRNGKAIQSVRVYDDESLELMKALIARECPPDMKIS